MMSIQEPALGSPNVAANARGLTRVGYTKLGPVHNVSRLSLQFSLYQHNESGVCAKFDLSEAIFWINFCIKVCNVIAISRDHHMGL